MTDSLVKADRYANMFDKLNAKQEGAFVPFVMVGDPDIETSVSIIKALIEGGADALELGFPYSDPIADGPTIQQAAIRALSHNIKTSQCFDVIKKVRQINADIPIGLLLYSNLVLKRGIEKFYADAAEAGVDSILIADVPLREADRFIAVAKQTGVKQILIAPPNASDETLAEIGHKSQGYTYLLGRAGVTGAETAVTIPADELITKLTQYKVAPPILGFGISTPKQVADAIQAGAAGAISGSATVNIVAENLAQPQVMFEKLTAFVSEMKQATR
ncbi:tryptophan synthase subunit alpha [Paraglaciecola aquimarina]|uniref:Tryptophan synthase alpha chain n=1 Tax=Paraglaciecola aquimarina TaxID=1235557 RepID=A0ABU3T0R7_9ALTE|nr:tryptophan synthase subunit alpha [Paraglaciecola aquimarina]MDU0355867.1 tryptophan synthase subunit alpha [Paraglaciecola aquimarina]